MEGTILGNRYELLKKIGEGGMANVYTARCRILNRIVAVKILKDEFTSDEEFVLKFRDEALAAASLNQGNIITIYDVGQEKDIPYIVMEYVDGIDIKEYIKRNGKQKEKKALNIILQIAMALTEAHRKKIIHRDIKPHNIMITKDEHVKVGDFGIAKAVTESTVTATHGGVLGSVHYFSPEQARGGYMDERSDIYSLGIVLYELLTATVPFSGETPVNVALKHIYEKVELPADIEVSESTRAILAKMTAKNVNHRYTSVEELIRDINEINKGERIHPTVNYEEEFETKKILFSSEEMIRLNEAYEGQQKSDDGENQPIGREDTMPKDNRSNYKMTIVAVVLAFVAAIAFLGTVFMVSGGSLFSLDLFKGEEIVLPSFTGKSLETARKEGESLGITIEKGEEVLNSRYEEGTITAQDPREGMKVKKGQVVKVTIAKAEEVEELPETKVPKVSNMHIDKAEELLDQAGLYSMPNFEYSASVEADIVISQEPEPGTVVKEKTEVVLKVSKGREEVLEKVPTLEGKTLEQAKAAQGSFKLDIGEKEDKSAADGVILSQNPKAGTEVKQGSTITVIVNKIEKPKEPVVVTKNMTILLPDKEQVHVRIKDASTGAVVYDKVENSAAVGGILSLNLDGKVGVTKQFEIYFDEEYVQTEAITFE